MAETYTYWISTALLCLLYLASAAIYMARRGWVRQALADLGYPAYLVPVMTAVKILGVAAILSRASVALSDLAYAGMLYHLMLSGLAHLGVRNVIAGLDNVGPGIAEDLQNSALGASLDCCNQSSRSVLRRGIGLLRLRCRRQQRHRHDCADNRQSHPTWRWPVRC